MSKSFYITTPIFYPNASLHMGHAYVVTVCDILARYHSLVDDDIYFLTGADENTGKILKDLSSKNQSVVEYLDLLTTNFKSLFFKLNISYDQFIRTSDRDRHWPGALTLWKKLEDSNDLYKSKYVGLYCLGCETFYTEKDLVDGKCPMHLTVPDTIEEENYFFRLSKYTNILKEKIKNNELKIIPETRQNEILALLERGLEDVSFSRPLKNVPHGIPVPGDPSQVIYVWCDALVNYISALGYGTNDESLFNKFWPVDVHVVGKDILRFHTCLWPAMLISAGLPLPKNILVHGLITSGGHKMSKSLGNIIDPLFLIDEYGGEALRYFLAREISLFEDGDLTLDKFKESYNANLANGLGNLASRILTLSEKYLDKCPEIPEKSDFDEYFKFYDNFEINKACDYVWQKIGELDKFIQSAEPFKVVKVDEMKGKKIITKMVLDLYQIARMLNPIMPDTNEKLKKLILDNKKPETPLFMRKD